MVLANTLSRAPLPNLDNDIEKELILHILAFTKNLVIDKKKLNTIKNIKYIK